MERFPELIALSETEREKALTRYRLLQPYLEGRSSLRQVTKKTSACLPNCPALGAALSPTWLGGVRSQAAQRPGQEMRNTRDGTARRRISVAEDKT